MRKPSFPFLLAALVFSTSLFAGCGASSTQVDTGYSTVKITVADTAGKAAMEIRKHHILADVARRVVEFLGANCASAAIPSEVSRITFTITASDMTTITRDTLISDQSSITESFTVPNGTGRRLMTQAKDAQGRVLYQGERLVDLSGAPVSISINMQFINEFTPPIFEGIQNIWIGAYGEGGSPYYELNWSAATDNRTPSSEIVYRIYMYPSDSPEAPPASTIAVDAYQLQTVTGETSTFIFQDIAGHNLYECYDGRPPYYFFLIKAVDSAGNIDTNEVIIRRSVKEDFYCP